MRREPKFRQHEAKLARRVCSRELEFFAFLKQIPVESPYQTGDDEVDKLIDLLEYEPAANGIFGAGKQKHAEHVAQIDQLIKWLEV
jgi:hypothetical protein